MTYVLYGLVVLFVLIILCRSVYVVPQGEQYTLERLGQFQYVMKPGLHFITPFICRISNRLNMMECVTEIPSLEAISSDNVTVRIDAVAYTQVFDAEKASYEVHNPFAAISMLINTTLRSALGEMTLDKIFSSRADINKTLMAIMDSATQPWGIKVTRIELKDVQPPHDLLEAMSAEMKAERTKRALILEAEGQRQAEVAKAEGAKQAWILKAEGTKQAQVLTAEGEKDAAILQAEAREALATAEANATRTVSAAITDGDDTALKYFLGVRYIEAFAKLAESENSKFVLMPSELTSLSNLVSGLKTFNK